MRNESGFTMVELIVVGAILAILAAAAIPNFIGWLPEHRLRSAADDINSCFQLAKLQAVRENAPVTIQVDAATDTLTVFMDDGNGGGSAENRVREGDEQAFKIVQMPNGIDLTANRTWFGYDGRGRPLGAQIGSTFLVNSRGSTLGVRTNFTGYPRYIVKVGSDWVLK